jgi:methylmalonyl-CoA mutase N-terminal domain/subunit
MYDRKKLDAIRKAKKKWEETSLKKELEEKGEWKKEFRTWDGLLVERIYTPLEMESRGWDFLEKLGFPGQYPFTRGRTATMFRGEEPRGFTYGGFGTAEATNKWLKYLIEQGGKESTVALDLPTQMGLDSDNPFARGEVGRQGVAVDSLADMETIYEGIDIGETYVGSVVPCIGPYYLALMLALADKRGIPHSKLHITMQNEPLKDYVARGTYIFPPGPAVEFACDAIEYVVKNRLEGVLPISYTGYHFREAGGTIYQELGFCLAIVVEFIEKLIGRGISIDDLPRAEVNLTSGVDLLQEVSKFRAIRRMWARMMSERFNAKSAMAMSFTHRAGSNSSLYTAQQPLNNMVRGTIAALVQVLGGVQYCHVAPYDEALSIPTAESAKLSLRTHQIVMHESGVANTIDPLAGSYYVETLTDEIEKKSMELFNRVQEMGGATKAIEEGFMRNEIAKAAHQFQMEIEKGERIWVGVNKYQDDVPLEINIMKVDPKEEDKQIEKVKKLRKERDNSKVEVALSELREATQKKVNLMIPLINAVKSYATTGEIFEVLKSIWGEYSEQIY